MRLSNDKNIARVFVIGHIGSPLNGQIQTVEYRNTVGATKISPTVVWW